MSGKNDMTKSDIEKLEERLRRAMMASDVAELDALISERLVFVLYDGTLLTKRDDLDTHRSGKIRIDTLTPSERQIQLHGSVAVVVVRMAVAGSHQGTPFSGDFRYMRVWHLEGEQAQVVAGHVSAIK